ncbi:hypothetical protein PVK63_19645 [Aliivibrio sp. S2TY2]|uniref:hypothetical protein n=1 Tax=unclassified Aliivibrio TaxID=2645654 RepID=UPI002377FD23|nr:MULTISPECIES: hypothetical protein [unclassified Aliivibrio]MDD9177073.1 hypothetical protein [Aliivibrio sp. S3TY1]MDD9194164.1 hypothetical protein [Aliivibrio sp. S2TY2]
MSNDLIDIFMNEDELGMVIRAHIYLEQHIDKYLSLVAYEPAYIDKMRLDFSDRLRLSVALGLDESFYKPITQLTNLRNRFAHKPQMLISKSDINNLYKSFEPEVQNDIQSFVVNGVKKGQKFKELILKDQFCLMMIVLNVQLAGFVRDEEEDQIMRIEDFCE